MEGTNIITEMDEVFSASAEFGDEASIHVSTKAKREQPAEGGEVLNAEIEIVVSTAISVSISLNLREAEELSRVMAAAVSAARECKQK